jgi:ligand-binding sensor domain-containing protein
MNRQARFFVVCLMIVLLLTNLGCGKKEPPKPKELEITHHTRLTGLPDEEISCMASFGGKLWAGSPNGLFAYDGVNWKQHVRKNTNVLGSDIIEDLKVNDNALWIATDNGAARYDGNNWSSVYTGGRARSVVGTSNQVAVATARGIEFSNNGAFKSMSKESAGLVYDEATQVLFDRMGALWVGTRAGMARMGSGIFQNFTGPAKSVMGSSLIDIPPSPANCQLIGNNVKVLAHYGDKIAVGTTSGLSVTDFSTGYTNYYSSHKDWFQRGGKIVEERVNGNSPLPGNVICSLASTPAAELLFVGTDKGLAILQGSTWIDTATLLKGVPKTTITALAFVDKDLWVGTRAGIYQVKDVASILEPAEK